HRARERSAIEQIALRDLHGHALERASITATAREHAHGGAEPRELAHDVGADEAGPAGDENHRPLASVASAPATLLSAASVPARSSRRSASAVGRATPAPTARTRRTPP